MNHEQSGTTVALLLKSLADISAGAVAALQTEEIRHMVAKATRAVAMAAEKAQSTVRKLEEEHHRAALLAAYRQRHRWKMSDRKNLLTLGVNRFAESRMQRLQGTGRPVVRPYQSLVEQAESRDQYRAILHSSSTTRHQRLQALRQRTGFWWPHYVEALYRGELNLAQANHHRGRPGAPALLAEEAVAQALALSAAKVHQLCVHIRKVRKACADDANLPATTVARFDQFLATGKRDGVFVDDKGMTSETRSD